MPRELLLCIIVIGVLMMQSHVPRSLHPVSLATLCVTLIAGQVVLWVIAMPLLGHFVVIVILTGCCVGWGVFQTDRKGWRDELRRLAAPQVCNENAALKVFGSAHTGAEDGARPHVHDSRPGCPD